MAHEVTQRTLSRVIRRKWFDWKHKAGRRLADLTVSGLTFEAARRLRKSGPISVLLDNSTLAIGVTHETAWISTGTKLWGGVSPIDTGYMARVPVHSHTSDAADYREVTYIVGIAALARRGLVKLLSRAS